MSFSGCIRTKLKDVSIFGKYAPKRDVQPSIMEKSKALALSSITLTFASAVTWDLDALVNDISVWLRDPTTSKTSKVGILSSPNFLELIKSSGGKVADSRFQLMMYATSLAYTRPTEPPLDTNDIYSIGCIAGHSFLNVLEEWLKPQLLQKCSQDGLRALFLMVFGTILSVGYCRPASDRDGATDDQNHDTRDMQSHICQILAHYILYLGSRLDLPIGSGIDQFILEAASSRWHKQGAFDWRTVEEDDEYSDEPNFEFYSLPEEVNCQGIHDVQAPSPIIPYLLSPQPRFAVDLSPLEETTFTELQLSGHMWDQIPRSWLCRIPDPVSNASINVSMPLEMPQWPESQVEGTKVEQGSFNIGSRRGNAVERGFREQPKKGWATSPACAPVPTHRGPTDSSTHGWACQPSDKEPQLDRPARRRRLAGQVVEKARQGSTAGVCWYTLSRRRCTSSRGVCESCQRGPMIYRQPWCYNFEVEQSLVIGQHFKMSNGGGSNCVPILSSKNRGCQMDLYRAGYVPYDRAAQSELPVKECLLV